MKKTFSSEIVFYKNKVKGCKNERESDITEMIMGVLMF